MVYKHSLAVYIIARSLIASNMANGFWQHWNELIFLLKEYSIILDIAKCEVFDLDLIQNSRTIKHLDIPRLIFFRCSGSPMMNRWLLYFGFLFKKRATPVDGCWYDGDQWQRGHEFRILSGLFLCIFFVYDH